jgi:casein kinase II subunit alpha
MILSALKPMADHRLLARPFRA